MCLHVDLESNVRFHLISLQQNILAVSAKQTQSLGRQMHLSHKVRLSLTSRILTYWTGEESWMPTGYRKLGCLRKPVSASTSQRFGCPFNIVPLNSKGSQQESSQKQAMSDRSCMPKTWCHLPKGCKVEKVCYGWDFTGTMRQKSGIK